MELEEEVYGELDKIEDDKGEWLRGCWYVIVQIKTLRILLKIVKQIFSRHLENKYNDLIVTIPNTWWINAFYGEHNAWMKVSVWWSQYDGKPENVGWSSLVKCDSKSDVMVHFVKRLTYWVRMIIIISVLVKKEYINGFKWLLSVRFWIKLSFFFAFG